MHLITILRTLDQCSIKPRIALWTDLLMQAESSQPCLAILCHPSNKSPVGFPKGQSLDPYYSPFMCVTSQDYDISQFADDTVHVASRSILETQHQLNTDLIQTARWLKSKKLHVNAIATQVILFGSRHALSRNPVLNISLREECLQQVECVKYLG